MIGWMCTTYRRPVYTTHDRPVCTTLRAVATLLQQWTTVGGEKVERLNVDRILDLIYRLRAGESERRISRDTGIARRTVHKYRQWAREQGYLDMDSPLPDLPTLVEDLGDPAEPPRQDSSLKPYEAIVRELLDQGCQMTVIHARLCSDYGYTGSYSSVRRYVHCIQPIEPEITVRVTCAPGEELQVDFGSVGMLFDPCQKEMRQAYVFVATLSCSRHQYAELVFDQKVETWIGLHRRAFEFFGGVPRRVVPDNLRAAIRKAAIHDPVPAKAYARMALHYGFLISPTRPHTPQHKGKVENGVRYVKSNFMAGQAFNDIDIANRRLRAWVVETAGRRIHGTTREEPLARFERLEREALLPLPETPFELCEVRLAKVHKDCHIQVQNARYSVPYAYVGHQVEVHIYERILQVFHEQQLLTTHPRADHPGQTLTQTDHYPPYLSQYLLEPRSYCRTKAEQIGPLTAQVVERLLADRPMDRLRAVQGILRLEDTVGPKRLEAACRRALHFGDIRFRCIKEILNAALDQQPLPNVQSEQPQSEHAFARAASEFFAAQVEQEVG